MQLSHIFNELIVKGGHDAQSIANSLNVSYKTVSRWIKGQVQPKLEYEIELRRLLDDQDYHNKHAIKRATIDHTLRGQFDKCFQELRESLYRWSKLSSRNEAIEELSKLLLAQMQFIAKRGSGLEKYHGSIDSESNASLLLDEINNAIFAAIPKNLISLMPKEEFILRIKKDEFRLLDEITSAFSVVDWAQIANVAKLDIFNEAFGKFLSDSFVEEKQLGQYLTPIEMVRFMVSVAIGSIKKEDYDILINPKTCSQFGLILDPSCGVGSFIIEFVHQLMPHIIEQFGEKGFSEWLENMSKVFVCLDKSHRMIKLAATNLAAIGIKCQHIYCLNSLDRKTSKKILVDFLENKVSLILTNPPFGAEFRDKDLVGYKLSSTWSQSAPKKIDSELLFIERYLDWLTINGQCIAVIPDNILTNKGIYSDLRKGIFNLIDTHGIISFPTETFSAAGTTAKTSVIHFSKRKTQTRKTYFAICNDIGFKVATKGTNKQKIKTDKNDLPTVLSEYFNKSEQCSFGRWVEISQDIQRWDATFHATLSHQLVNILSKSSKNILVSDVASLSNDRIDPRRLFNQFRYIEISDIDSEKGIVHSKVINGIEAPSRARKLVKFGDVLASTVRPEQKKVGVVANPLDDNAVCTTGLAVLHPKQIEPYLLATLLRTDFVTKQLIRFNIGVAYPAVDESCFSGIVLPITEKEATDFSKLTAEILFIENELIKKREILFKELHDSVSKWSVQ